MNSLACAIPTMRISIEGRGKVVRSAAISGRQEITNSMRRTPSIGPDIERGKPVSSGPNHGHENCPPEGSFRHPKLCNATATREKVYMAHNLLCPTGKERSTQTMVVSREWRKID